MTRVTRLTGLTAEGQFNPGEVSTGYYPVRRHFEPATCCPIAQCVLGSVQCPCIQNTPVNYLYMYGFIQGHIKGEIADSDTFYDWLIFPEYI